MRTVRSAGELHALLGGERGTAFVPTMGNLHRGHIALVQRAGELGGPVVASVFVNRLQFGAGEDFDHYPRTLDDDAKALAAAGCDILFAPDESVIYPTPQTILVQAPPEADQLCGANRPGHFDGVLTVVCKLFNLVQPAVAVFGEKDFQQLWLIRRMVEQLSMPVWVVPHPTERNTDGLALSSRNRYLSPAQRTQAPQLFAALCQVRDALQAGGCAATAVGAASDRLACAGWQVDYIASRDAKTLREPGPATRDWVVLGAARLGTTRLIDNLRFGTAQWGRVCRETMSVNDAEGIGDRSAGERHPDQVFLVPRAGLAEDR
jgi:pantoate--beta-alanine ligase